MFKAQTILMFLAYLSLLCIVLALIKKELIFIKLAEIINVILFVLGLGFISILLSSSLFFPADDFEHLFNLLSKTPTLDVWDMKCQNLDFLCVRVVIVQFSFILGATEFF